MKILVDGKKHGMTSGCGWCQNMKFVVLWKKKRLIVSTKERQLSGWLLSV